MAKLVMHHTKQWEIVYGAGRKCYGSTVVGTCESGSSNFGDRFPNFLLHAHLNLGGLGMLPQEFLKLYVFCIHSDLQADFVIVFLFSMQQVLQCHI